jgi:hypothetical protein
MGTLPSRRRASAAGPPPQPAPAGCPWRRDSENPGTAAQAARGRHSPVPKIPGIRRELPGPVHIVAIRPPASF